MGLAIVFALLAVAVLLGPFAGVDSRRADPRGWWPGRRS
jgi:hypothetical protein